MKKFLSAMSLAFVLNFLGSIANITTANAEDVWVSSGNGINTYVMTESIRGKVDFYNGKPVGVWVNLKRVDQNDKVSMSIAMFHTENMTWSAEFPNGMRNLGPISDSQLGSAIWKAIQPYLSPKFR